MATQTFARLLLCGAAILTVLVAIPVVVTALGGAEAEQDQGPAVLASGLLNRGGTHIGVTVRDVEGGRIRPRARSSRTCGRRAPPTPPGSSQVTSSSSSMASACGARDSSRAWCRRPRPAGPWQRPSFEPSRV